MELFETLYTRRAIRKFLDMAVDRNTILALIDAAIQAPSALDLQPWGFAVVQDRAVMGKISEASKHHLLAGGLTGALAQHHKSLSDPAFDIFYGAPVLVVVCATGASNPEAAAEDCCLAAENFMLAAHAKGLGTCWVGFARGWLGTDEAKRLLGIPVSWRPIAPLILGLPAHLPPPPPRQEPKIVWQKS